MYVRTALLSSVPDAGVKVTGDGDGDTGLGSRVSAISDVWLSG